MKTIIVLTASFFSTAFAATFPKVQCDLVAHGHKRLYSHIEPYEVVLATATHDFGNGEEGRTFELNGQNKVYAQVGIKPVTNFSSKKTIYSISLMFRGIKQEEGSSYFVEPMVDTRSFLVEGRRYSFLNSLTTPIETIVEYPEVDHIPVQLEEARLVEVRCLSLVE